MICNLCPHKCAAYKDKDTIGGKCGVSANIKVARIAPHHWEEPVLSGEKGSGAVFFSGCTLKCIYCQNSEISADNYGVEITPSVLAEEFRKLEAQGVHNIDLISATQFLPAILRAFDIYKPKIPIVYNCGGYERVEALKALEGIVDIYLPDFKYSDDALAKEYSGAENYTQVAADAIKEMFRQTGRLTVSEEGIAQRGVLVRHLVLPNHTRNSINALNILKENFGDDLTLSLMGQYIPHGKAMDHPKLNRKITKREYEKVLSHLINLDIEGFAQELESADEGFIPLWNYKID